MRVFVSWSGGKDSCLALYRVLKAGFKVEFLFSMLCEEGSLSRTHGLKKEVIDAQAKAIGFPIVHGNASWETYEAEFKKIVNGMRCQGIEGGVFGDINIQEHKDWVEKVCKDIGIKSFEPLWKEKYETLLDEFIGNGFEAIVISAKANFISEKWVGHKFDHEFTEYLRSRNLDLYGETGQYHTFVTSGPIFKQKIKILDGKKILKNDWLFFEILKFNTV